MSGYDAAGTSVFIRIIIMESAVSLARSGLVWPGLARSCPVLPSLVQSGPVWSTQSQVKVQKAPKQVQCGVTAHKMGNHTWTSTAWLESRLIVARRCPSISLSSFLIMFNVLPNPNKRYRPTILTYFREQQTVAEEFFTQLNAWTKGHRELLHYPRHVHQMITDGFTL